MKKSYLVNLILIALIIGLYCLNNKADTPTNNATELTSLNSSDIQHIRISRPNVDSIELEKSASGWQLIQPLKAPANNKRVELLLSFLNTESYAKISVNNEVNLSQFGLEPSDIVLTLDDYTVQFGNIAPINKRRYVLAGNVIHLITDRITPLLQANASSFIENKLIPSQNTITKLVLPMRKADNTLSTTPLTIENIDGHWQSDYENITSDERSAFVQNWQNAYALQVLTLTPAHQNKSSNNKVKLWFKDNYLPSEFELQLTHNAIFLIDQQQQLRYQFPLVILPQLLPLHDIEP